MNKKVIISGNKNYGLAQALHKTFPEAEFFSRSNKNFDLSKYEKREEFAELSLEYDLYISCSYISQFRQTLLLEAVYHRWKRAGKKGQIICVGSTADMAVKGTEWIYPVEKKALKAYCANLSIASAGGASQESSGIRVTYLSPGYLNTPKANEKHPNVSKIDLDYLANVILWLSNQPASINIRDMGLDPVQQ